MLIAYIATAHFQVIHPYLVIIDDAQKATHIQMDQEQEQRAANQVQTSNI